MKNKADYSKYECPYSHLEKESGHALHGPEGHQDVYGVWCACGFRAPVFFLDPDELGLKLKNNIKEFPFIIRDKNGNLIYYEESNGYWIKRDYDSNGNKIYYEDSRGYWEKSEYDSNRNLIYYENSRAYWIKKKYDSNGNKIYYEDSDGKIIDNRPKQSFEGK